MLFPTSELSSINFEIEDIADVNELKAQLQLILEKIRVHSTSSKEISAVNISRYTENGFQIYKVAGLIQYVGFNSVGEIIGSLPISANLEIGATFYLFNESENPLTNLVRIALGSHVILTDDSITELVLDHNEYILVLIYIAPNTFLASKILVGV